ncbi:hypothetical protein [Brassicibacter mesophilus]|uniref:hypothetical protein n=1 Tax=Brassicibacter mesophilus TaxID=745119 RepID=UPI003D1DDA26
MRTYSSRDLAEVAIERFKKLPSLKYYLDDFYIDEYVIDKNNWSKDFVEFSSQRDLYTKLL